MTSKPETSRSVPPNDAPIGGGDAEGFDLGAYLADRRARIDCALERFLAVTPASTRIDHAMHHCLMAGGKRLRPILCLASGEAVGAPDPKALMPTACALEMVHTYSLIHDDLPAMDNDDLRRGRATCHVAFDEATAILAGDGLLTLAFEILARLSQTGMPAAVQLEVVRTLAAAAGHKGMIEGQMRDMAAEGRRLELRALEALHALKTGALIRAAVCSGALLGGADSRQLKSLSIYAADLGLAFQVTDDILNVEGDPVIMGKAAGTDARREKNTYPALLGLKQSKRWAGKLVERALKVLEDFDNRSDPLRAIARYVLRRQR